MHIYFLERVELGVVLPDRLQMREGTDERAAERAEIHAGLRVEILDREDGWMRIELANGHEGWVPADAIGAL
jgi:SH3-like domain-containing protein